MVPADYRTKDMKKILSMDDFLAYVNGKCKNKKYITINEKGERVISVRVALGKIDLDGSDDEFDYEMDEADQMIESQQSDMYLSPAMKKKR